MGDGTSDCTARPEPRAPEHAEAENADADAEVIPFPREELALRRLQRAGSALSAAADRLSLLRAQLEAATDNIGDGLQRLNAARERIDREAVRSREIAEQAGDIERVAAEILAREGIQLKKD